MRNDLLLVMLLAVLPAEAAIVAIDTDGFIQQVESTSAQKLDLDWPAIERLYAPLGGRPIWHDNGRLNRLGRRLLSWLAASAQEGLNPTDYHVGQLRRLDGLSWRGDYILRELLLSDGYLRLAVDLRQGDRPLRVLDSFRVADADAFDPVAILLKALAGEKLAGLLAQLGPTNEEYRRLRQALARYRGIQQTGEWPRVVSEISLRPGQRDPQVARLRERLARESERFSEQSDQPELFDAGLEAELKRFQRRHGLEPDGVAGPATLEALNVPVARRIEQLRINLERWRWLPHELDSEYLRVNTAGFELVYRSHGRVIFSGRTVNGSGERPTPSMVSLITHLVANPQWTVPRRIAIEDMLPQQRADPGYLSRKRIRVYRRNDDDWEEVDPSVLDWSAYHRDNFPFVFRQDAGAGNSLGRIKFHMPNSNAIYLHDTPAVGLFGRSDRALSSGCVRVEGAEHLARLLIRRTDPWEARRFNLAMKSGETRITPLREPLTVYLTYFTSWVDEAGEVHFRPDIYQRDAELMLAFGHRKQPLTVRRQGDSLPASL